MFDDRLSRVRFLAVYSPSILLMRLPSICSYLICYVRYIPIRYLICNYLRSKSELSAYILVMKLKSRIRHLNLLYFLIDGYILSMFNVDALSLYSFYGSY